MRNASAFRTLCVAAILAAPAAAQDGVASSGRLADEDFFRLATCGAPPGGDCRSDTVRWPKSRLTLTLSSGEAEVSQTFEDRLNAAIDHAVREINQAGAGIQIRVVNSKRADITIRPTDIAEGATLKEIQGFSSKGVMGVGYVSLWWDGRARITEASILISTEISDADLTSVMLEEITQSLGFLYDIENPAYEGVSILSQTSNATTRITGQDARLLRWHYPP